MPPKSNNQKKKEAEAAGRAPKKTKQQENAGKSAKQKKEEMKAKKVADKVSSVQPKFVETMWKFFNKKKSSPGKKIWLVKVCGDTVSLHQHRVDNFYIKL